MLVRSRLAAPDCFLPARVDRASGTNIVDEYLIPWPAPRCRRIVSCARRTSAGTRLNTVPLVSWPLAAPFSAKCAYFECLNLGVQSSLMVVTGNYFEILVMI